MGMSMLHLRSIAAGLLLALLAPPLAGQDGVRVQDGKRFKEHTVVAGQTLYGISRHYAVPVSVLMEANPSAAEGLRVGQVVLVPQDAVNEKELRSAPSLRPDGELVHVVARKETLYGIAKRYGIEQAALIERNPALMEGLKAGMELVIPQGAAQGVPAAAARPAPDDTSRSHLVQAGETLFALCARFGVSIEAMREANGGLVDGLREGQVLTVPRPAQAVEAPPQDTTRADSARMHVVRSGETLYGLGRLYGVPVDAMLGANGGLPNGLNLGDSLRIPFADVQVVDTISRDNRYQIGLLLPLCLVQNDSIDGGEPTKPGLYSVTDISAQFLAGAQIAIDSMAGMGMNMDVHLYDVGENSSAWTRIVRDPSRRTMHLFLGPFHRGAVEILASTAPGSHIVCPVTQNSKLILGRRNVSRVTGGRTDIIRQMGKFVASRHAADNVILLRPDFPSEKEVQDQLQRAVQEVFDQTTVKYRDSVLVIRTGRRDGGSLWGSLVGDRHNVLLVPSEDVEFVSTLVRKLVPLAAQYKLVVYGMHSWTNMDVVSHADLDRVNLRVPVASYVFRQDPAVRAFERRFRARFATDAGPYAFLGFDVAFYYLKALKQEGPGFAERFDLVETKPLHMRFRMKRMGEENGFGNEGVVILELKDLVLRPVD